MKIININNYAPLATYDSWVNEMIAWTQWINEDIEKRNKEEREHEPEYQFEYSQQTEEILIEKQLAFYARYLALAPENWVEKIKLEATGDLRIFLDKVFIEIESHKAHYGLQN